MKKDLFQEKPSQTFELVLNVLNSKGEPTGRKESFSSDSAYKIWVHYMKKRSGLERKKNGGAVNAKEAEKILQSLYGKTGV